MEPVSVGILGFAHGHVGMYCARWREQPELGVRVVAGWDHDAARAAESCARYGIERGAVGAGAARARATWTPSSSAPRPRMHADLVEQAAAAGKAIVLQKPHGPDAGRGRPHRGGRAARAGVPFTLAWQMRVGSAQPADEVAAGRAASFGRVFMVRRRHCLSTHLWKDFDKSWHVQPRAEPRHLRRRRGAPDRLPLLAAGHAGERHGGAGHAAATRAIPNDNGIAVFRYAGRLLRRGVVHLRGGGRREHDRDRLRERASSSATTATRRAAASRGRRAASSSSGTCRRTGAWTVSDLPDITSQGERIAGLAGAAGGVPARPPPAHRHGRGGPRRAAPGAGLLRVRRAGPPHRVYR